MILQIVFLEKSEFCHKMKYDELFIPYRMGGGFYYYAIYEYISFDMYAEK